MQVLKLQTRNKTNSSGLDKLRSEGYVPGIVYGMGQENMFSVDYRDMEKVMRKGCFFNTLLNVELDGKVLSVLPKAAASHVVTDKILHLEFHAVEKDTQVDTEVPVQCVGLEKSEVIKRGAKILYALKYVKVRCKASAIPTAIMLDVSALGIGEMLKIRDLNLIEGVQLKHPDHLTIIKITGKKEK